MNANELARWGKPVVIEVVPQGHWTYWESANMRGSPATHLIDPQGDGYTLCHRDAEGWDRPYIRDAATYLTSEREQAICKVCWQVMQRRVKS